MIDDCKKNEAHRSCICNFRGPLRSSFFLFSIASMSQTKKSSRVYVYPLVRIFFTMFIFTRTYLTNIIPQTCYFSKCLYFYILRFDTYFKIKKFISREVYNNSAIDGTYVQSIAEIIFVQSWRASTHPNPYVRMLKGFFNFLHPTRT